MFHPLPDPGAIAPASHCILIIGPKAWDWAQATSQQWRRTRSVDQRLYLVSLLPTAARSDWLARCPELRWAQPAPELADFWWLSEYAACHPAGWMVQHAVWFGDATALLGQLPAVFDQVWCSDAPASSDPTLWPPQRWAAVMKPRGLLAWKWYAPDQQAKRYREKGFEPLPIPPTARDTTAHWYTNWPQPPQPASLDWLTYQAPWLRSRHPRIAPTARLHDQSPLAALPRVVTVIGAGLAGALVAHAFAARGWQVTVLEAAPTPAAGASGLPVGLLCPQIQSSDPLAELTRIGVMATLSVCQTLLKNGHDYQVTGVEIQYPREAARAPHFVANAGWVKPAALVRACLDHPKIKLVTGFRVDRLSHVPGAPGAPDTWLVHPAPATRSAAISLQTVGSSLVVLANAEGFRTITVPEKFATAQARTYAIGGQVSMGDWADQPVDHSTPPPALPPQPVNGLGHLLPRVPIDGQLRWVVGSSYRQGCADASVQEQDHHDNLARAQTLWPGFRQIGDSGMNHRLEWAGVRWTTPTRVPRVGPLATTAGTLNAYPPFVLLGFGSRGLSLAPLCAQILLSQLLNEPSPVPKRLLALMHPARYISKTL